MKSCGLLNFNQDSGHKTLQVSTEVAWNAKTKSNELARDKYNQKFCKFLMHIGSKTYIFFAELRISLMVLRKFHWGRQSSWLKLCLVLYINTTGKIDVVVWNIKSMSQELGMKLWKTWQSREQNSNPRKIRSEEIWKQVVHRWWCQFARRRKQVQSSPKTVEKNPIAYFRMST